MLKVQINLCISLQTCLLIWCLKSSFTINITHFFSLWTLSPWCCQSSYARSWWRHQMETFAVLLAICAGNSPVPGEFPSQRPVTQTFDVYFYLRLNKRLSKRSWGWWFETLSSPLWRHSSMQQGLATTLITGKGNLLYGSALCFGQITTRVKTGRYMQKFLLCF